jgi:hypothetical protein
MRLEVVKVVKVVAKLETFGNNIGIKFCARLEDIEDSRQSCGFQRCCKEYLTLKF